MRGSSLQHCFLITSDLNTSHSDFGVLPQVFIPATVANFSILLDFADSGFVPIFMYAIFGSSRQLAIGPVALVSLLVSNILGSLVDSSDELYTELAILLALMVGVMECTMGLLRYIS